MNIKSFIIERGLSVKQVADNMGISSPALSQLLSGNPTVQKIQDIAEKGIGCKRWEFFIDEMDRSEVARILGLTAHTAPQPAAESASAPQPSAEQQEELPFGQQQPSVPASLICPHCGTPFVVEVKEK